MNRNQRDSWLSIKISKKNQSFGHKKFASIFVSKPLEKGGFP
jgi:hypothetical protein